MPVERGNWVVRRRGPEGVLTNAQTLKLSEDFGISEQDVQALSKSIAYPLSPEFFVGSVVKVLKQQEKGPKELDILLTSIRQAEVRLATAVAQIDLIRIQFPNAGRGVEDPNTWLTDELAASLTKVQFIRGALERSTKKYATNFLGEPDRRKNRDERQWSILFAIFDAWKASSRKISITSHGVTSERSGPLVDFTNAVVSYVTDPVTQLKGETVWQAIKEWREAKKREEQVDQFKKNS